MRVLDKIFRAGPSSGARRTARARGAAVDLQRRRRGRLITTEEIVSA